MMRTVWWLLACSHYNTGIKLNRGPVAQDNSNFAWSSEMFNISIAMSVAGPKEYLMDDINCNIKESWHKL